MEPYEYTNKRFKKYINELLEGKDSRTIEHKNYGDVTIERCNDNTVTIYSWTGKVGEGTDLELVFRPKGDGLEPYIERSDFHGYCLEITEGYPDWPPVRQSSVNGSAEDLFEYLRFSGFLTDKIN